MLPIQVTIRDIPTTDALDINIRKHAEKLSQFYDRISSCRIVVELSKNHPHQGKIFNVRIDITVPGKELVATHKYDADVYVAIRDAFNAIGRQLENYARKRHGQIKLHDIVMRGHIARIIHQEGYGFIEGIDGNEYYFSMTNVTHPSFEQLSIGDAVEYIPQTVNDGRQANRVTKQKVE
jgi:ribosomal subunit interface protein